jgi:hypothetical protein
MKRFGGLGLLLAAISAMSGIAGGLVTVSLRRGLDLPMLLSVVLGGLAGILFLFAAIATLWNREL